MQRNVMKLIVVATALVASAAPQARAASNLTFTDDNVTRVFAAGSDSTYFALADLATAYNGSEGCRLNAVAKPAVLQQNRCQGATVPEGVAQTNVVTTENYDHDLVINYFPQGSNAGRTQLCDQTSPRSALVPPVDFARSSSAPGVGFQCSGYTGTLRFVAFAKDALTWTHWNTGTGGGSTVTNLTVTQLRRIWTCDPLADTWNEVGGSNTNPIVFYTAAPGSGSRSAWESFLGLTAGTSDACMAAAFKDGNLANGERVIRENYHEAVEQALNDPAAADEGNSIFFTSVGVHTSEPAARQSSLMGTVNGIAATETTILDGSFPLSRFLYNVLRNTGPGPVASEAARRFTNMSGTVGSQGWLCKPHNTHSKPVGDPGAGIANAAASRNYGDLPPLILRQHGFFPLIPEANTTTTRCAFEDYSVFPSRATFTNATPLSIREPGQAGEPWRSELYPSPVTVSGMSGTVTDVNVILTDIDCKVNGGDGEWPDDMDLLLVGPTGADTMLVSDVGGAAIVPQTVDGVTLTLDSGAASFLPEESTPALSSGIFKPTDDDNDTELLPVDSFTNQRPEMPPGEQFVGPTPSGNSLLTVYNGTAPNGTWNLYFVDDYPGFEECDIEGGWSLDISTSA